MACSCPIHSSRDGKPVGVTRAERLRGYEIEISSAKVNKLQDPAVCKGHATKCNKGRACSIYKLQNERSGECNCVACELEQKVKPKPWECPGHPCMEGRDSARMLRNLVVDGAKGGYAVEGAFTNHRNTPKDNNYWDLKTDGSCGYELVTPPMQGEEVSEVLAPVLAKINEVEYKHRLVFVDNSCGLHVTFDVQSVGTRGLKRILFSTLRHQAALIGTQPAYRKGNGYCRPIAAGMSVKKTLARATGMKKFSDAGRGMGLDAKYHLINIGKALRGSGLVEFRFGGASTSVREIEAFGVLCECLIDSALNRPHISDSKDARIRLYKEVIEPYISDRRVKESWESVLYPKLAKAKL